MTGNRHSRAQYAATIEAFLEVTMTNGKRFNRAQPWAEARINELVDTLRRERGMSERGAIDRARDLTEQLHQASATKAQHDERAELMKAAAELEQRSGMYQMILTLEDEAQWHSNEDAKTLLDAAAVLKRTI